ncbi:hypothetical protein [Klenkia soli]|uniref:hypothetical protein n=1 Tax=Klenkia soli TaxID=1052260 RepID=UPI0010421F2E|nr:hypothetical protein [Klenkia soli]
MSLPRRIPVVLAAATVLLAGCTSTVEGTASPSPTTAGAPSSSGSGGDQGGDQDPDGLAAGLLPEDAFGAGAQVSPVTEADVRAGAAVGADLAGVTITPEACAQAIQQSQPSVEDLEDFAAQTATSGTSVVVQLLTVGAPGDPVADLAASVATCPQATLTSPEIGTATITFSALDVPALGDGSAGLSYTTSVTGPDGSQLTIPALIAVAVDGDRLLTVLSTSIGGSTDTAAFTDLVQQAYDYQADQLD